MKQPGIYLGHLLGFLERIERYTKEGRDAFFANDIQQDAVFRNVELIGEVVKRLDDSVRSKEPEIEWRKIAGLRDILIHAYTDVRLDVVWDAIVNDLPLLKLAIRRLQAFYPPTEHE